MQKAASFFIVFAAVIAALILGQNLLLPLLFALLLWVLLRGVKLVLDKNDWIKDNVPSWLKNLSVSALFFFILAAISKVLSINIKILANSYKKYESNINETTAQLNSFFDINIAELIKSNTESIDFNYVLSALFNSFSDIISNVFMVSIYFLFIILEEKHFKHKMAVLFTHDEEEHNKVTALLEKMENAVIQYLGLKTLVSIFTGFISYFVFAYVGIDAPVFWAFLIFLFNYIPTIGSIVGTFFPAIFCLLQFGSFTEGAIVLFGMGSIQVLIGNIIEPKIMGNTLNLSPLVAIFSLTFWGVMWGVTGMIMSIPITVILIIVMAQFKSTRSIAVLLSEDGKV